jgi:signal transduction histidine kinase
MKVERVVAWGGWLTIILAVAVCLGIATLLGFGYRATREWQRSSSLLVERDTAESADLIVTALGRDMQGAQARVLANRDWGELSIDSLTDTSDQVATAFARYPYPESFFSWRVDRDGDILFFNRANRYPAWMPRTEEPPHRFPVVVVRNPAGAEPLRKRIDAYGTSRYRYVAFNTDLAGQPYQVIARLGYADPLDERLQSVIGFTVNLTWVRGSYFPDIFSQVVNRGSRLDIAVLDDRGHAIFGGENTHGAMVREFPLLFLDPSTSRVALAPDTLHTWKIAARQTADSSLLGAAQGADETLLVVGAAALTLGVGLILAIRAVRAGVELTAMRSEFVSSVTHELKMPLANIRAMADTLARRPIAAAKIRTYAEYLLQEAKRLTRLVDNLLAYSRITDVTNIYSFEPIAPAELVDDVLQTFRQPIAEREFTVEVDIPVDLPLVRADRAAMILALDNVFDNAIRYSPDRGSIHVTARQHASIVSLEVKDRGTGIPADELPAVRKKFVRGRGTRSNGSGLGLAIVSRIVADHNGTFVLESEYGVGSTARVTLPVAGD